MKGDREEVQKIRLQLHQTGPASGVLMNFQLSLFMPFNSFLVIQSAVYTASRRWYYPVWQ